uniref:Uncharacterized protein n=1 Tax=Fagus sylvatica TaxID=28930 RepID=A0A2N9HTP3_FAGSY
MESIPPPNNRSDNGESDGGADLPFRSPEDRVLECECGGDAWWCVNSPAEHSNGAWLLDRMSGSWSFETLRAWWCLDAPKIAPIQAKNSGKCGSHRRHQL